MLWNHKKVISFFKPCNKMIQQVCVVTTKKESYNNLVGGQHFFFIVRKFLLSETSRFLLCNDNPFIIVSHILLLLLLVYLKYLVMSTVIKGKEIVFKGSSFSFHIHIDKVHIIGHTKGYDRVKSFTYENYEMKLVCMLSKKGADSQNWEKPIRL